MTRSLSRRTLEIARCTRLSTARIATVIIVLMCQFVVAAEPVEQPSILWIYVDDMSDWLGCSGDPIAETPNLDRLAARGIRFTHARMPSPVCSTTRSALIAGTMQTTLGLHQHRTMIKRPLPEGIQTVPQLMRQAGYVTFNEARDDYNFRIDRSLMYSPEFSRPGYRSHLRDEDLTWLQQLQGKTFFGQVQLAGGKLGGETGSQYPSESRVPRDQITVPPQYPDTPVFRDAIARHYEQIAQTDSQAGAIVAALERYDLLDNTVIIFFTDHGSPLPRSKQFLYEEGIRVPLIITAGSRVKLPQPPGSVRSDLVSGIDISATTLALAGVDFPDWMEGRDLFAEDFTPRSYVISARDRNGIAVDRIRAVRTYRFLYIRNFLTDRPLFQSQYRDGYATFRDLRAQRNAGQLSPLQMSFFDAGQRPAEELYEVSTDPHQIDNLAGRAAFQKELLRHREILNAWIKNTDDNGQYPEEPESLELVFRQAKGKCPAPEFNFLRQRDELQP